MLGPQLVAVFWEVLETGWLGLFEGSRSLEVCLWKLYLIPSPFLPLCFLSTNRWRSSSETHSCHRNVLPKSMELSSHGLSPLRTVSQNKFFLHQVVSLRHPVITSTLTKTTVHFTYMWHTYIQTSWYYTHTKHKNI
jgi:hypothetical protein